AAFLYNFALFTEWPEGTFSDDDSAIVFVVLGEDPFGSILDKTIAGKTIHGRPLIVRRHREISEVTDCHILYVSQSEQKRLKDIFSKITGKHMFSVSEIEGFSSGGGTARFLIKNSRVSLEINTDTAAREQLSISSKLLKLATLVHDQESAR
ncbi:MAG: hypothetical protein ACI9EF_001122, partial [Pseudohongiellaceae bacterium]